MHPGGLRRVREARTVDLEPTVAQVRPASVPDAPGRIPSIPAQRGSIPAVRTHALPRSRHRLDCPFDHWYRLQHRNAQPMGAIDHLVLAMGVSLCRLNGHDAVAILTSDARMSRAVRRAKSLSASQTAALNLLGRASELGYRWRPEIYPRVIDLQRMPDSALRDLFGAWPLPTRSPRGIEPRARGIR
jgi:hypothetical protein